MKGGIRQHTGLAIRIGPYQQSEFADRRAALDQLMRVVATFDSAAILRIAEGLQFAARHRRQLELLCAATVPDQPRGLRLVRQQVRHD